MDNFAFASARQLRTALNESVLDKAQVLAVLQERKERKECKCGGKKTCGGYVKRKKKA